MRREPDLIDAYAAVVRDADGSDTVIGTCAVAAGAAAFAVSCGHPNARVVRIPADVAERVAVWIIANAVELSDDEINSVGAACVRAMG